MIYELGCRYDSRKSFYGKAHIEEKITKGEHGETRLLNLISYNTTVAKILYSDIDNEKTITYLYMGKYSQTTTRHQREFFKQNGLDDRQIKELFKNEELIIEREY